MASGTLDWGAKGGDGEDDQRLITALTNAELFTAPLHSRLRTDHSPSPSKSHIVTLLVEESSTNATPKTIGCGSGSDEPDGVVSC